VIVIFSREDDRHALSVAEVLTRRHNEAVTIFDLSAYPADVRLSCRFSGSDGSISFADRSGRRIDFGAVRSFWWRRPQALRLDARIADTSVQYFALQESMSALYGMLRCCPGLWVNDIEHDQNADYKPRQLAAVRRHGLLLADTLITNDPNEARAFFEQHDGEVVYKSFNQRGLIWSPTRRLAASDLPHLETLQCAPVIFQRYVEGTRDIRVTAIGDNLIATEFGLDETTAPALEARLAIAASGMLARAIDPWLDGELEAVPQPEDGATMTRPLHREDGRLDPEMPAWLLERQVRAYLPWPGSFLETDGQRLVVLAGAVAPSDADDEPGRIVPDPAGLALATADGRLVLVEVAFE
jgi:hypothetical protein